MRHDSESVADAKLFSLIAKYERREKAFCDHLKTEKPGRGPVWEAEERRLCRRADKALVKVEECRPKTLPGVLAFLQLAHEVEEESHTTWLDLAGVIERLSAIVDRGGDK